MEVIAVAKGVRISPRKVRLVADAIRQQPINDALVSLRLIRKRASMALEKTIRSAVANAVNNAKLNASDLRIAQIEVSEGTPLKRFHPSTRGRVHPYKKRSSHIKVVLSAQEKGEQK